VVDIVPVPEFSKDLHKLRKYNSIEEDLGDFKKILIFHLKDIKKAPLDVKELQGFGEGFLPAYKARKFSCQYLKNKRDIRVVFTYDSYEDEIILIEIYHKNKNNRSNHNPKLVKKYLIKKKN